MRRFAMITVLACVLTAPGVLAQSQSTAKKAAYVPPVKDVATLEVIQGTPKRVGKEMVTVLKIKNTSKGSINLLKLDEYWYDANLKIISGSQYAHTKAPLQPGEIIEVTLRAAVQPGMSRSQVIYSHAYGKADAKAVKAFK